MRYLEKHGVNGAAGGLDAKYYIEIALNSTETKPTDMIADGSVALETDTGKVYVFNEASTAWVLYKTVKVYVFNEASTAWVLYKTVKEG